MATEAWIDSATREQRPALASDTELTGYHVLAMARADAEYEAAERDRARRCVLRLAGDDAGDMLDALGLADGPAEPRRICGTMRGYNLHRKRGETACDDCLAAARVREADRRAARRAS